MMNYESKMIAYSNTLKTRQSTVLYNIWLMSSKAISNLKIANRILYGDLYGDCDQYYINLNLQVQYKFNISSIIIFQ